MIATGVSRLALNENVIKNWVEKHYSVSYQLLSTEQEIRCVYHAAGKWGSGEEAIAVDIGGSSTEVVYMDRFRKEQGISLPLGLLCLLDDCAEDLGMARKMINKQLITIGLTEVYKFIGVGLTYSYLAAVVYKKPHHNPDMFDGVTITIDRLQAIANDIDSGLTEQYLPYLLEKNYLPILRLSILYNISLLDKFGLSEIIVCSDGISVGYAKARFQKEKRKGNK